MRDNIYITLIGIIAPLSLLSVGGGQSVLPEMHRQIVELHGYISEAQFLADYTISRMNPGPTSLIVALIGWQVAGWWGAVVTTISIFVPSSILVLLLARIWARSRGAAWQIAVERGLAPLAAGLILASTVTLARGLSGGWLSVVITLLSTLAMTLTRLSPLWVIGGGAVMFLVLGG